MDMLANGVSSISREDNISDLLHKFFYVDYEMRLSTIVAKVDWTEHSSVAVLDRNKHIFGIITEQDIVEAKKKHQNFNVVMAWEICGHNLKTVLPDTTINEVMEIMAENRIHHVIIMDSNKLEGIVSALDIVAALVKHY